MLKKWFFLGLLIFGFLCADYAYITLNGPRAPISVEFQKQDGEPMDSISDKGSDEIGVRRKVASTGPYAKKNKKSKDIPWGRVSHQSGK